MKYICNPVNINYRFQFNMDPRKGGILQIDREAADPSMIMYHGRYYVFASMTLGVWVSDDLVNWENHRLPEDLPLYDYAPDVRVMGDYVYFCASRRTEACDRYRTKDVLNGPYEKIPGNFPFWDPNMFIDDDGRIYFYWGCSNTTPIWGTELDPQTLLPIGEKQALIEGDPHHIGYERVGEDHSVAPASEEEIEMKFQGFLKRTGVTEDQLPPGHAPMIRGMFSNMPYIEGAWMDKHNGKYYLQYAFPGTEYNVYGDGCYVSDSPLGPFVLADNAPFSYKPGGFLPGAGHGSSMEDRNANWWHIATMRISVHHDFERRVGMFPAGFDADGDFFCNQRYGDWPLAVEEAQMDPWRGPAWYLLSYNKKMTASSCMEGNEPEKAADENVQTWWRAASADRKEWLQMDLGKEYTVNMVQVNFADVVEGIEPAGELVGSDSRRYIEERDLKTQWKLLGSLDGENWFTIEDKSAAETDLTHDQVLREEGIKVRYLCLTDIAVAYGMKPCVSGLRVFGIAEGEAPEVPEFTAKRVGPMNMDVEIAPVDAVGYNILWGSAPDKLYHSYMVFGTQKNVGALVEGREYYVRVDAFNESGITEGKCVKLA